MDTNACNYDANATTSYEVADVPRRLWRMRWPGEGTTAAAVTSPQVIATAMEINSTR